MKLADVADLKLALLLTLNFSMGSLHILASILLLKSLFYGEFRPSTLIQLNTNVIFKLRMKVSRSRKYSDVFSSPSEPCLHILRAKFKIDKKNSAIGGI